LLLLAACNLTAKPDEDLRPRKPAPLASELPEGQLYATARSSSFTDMLEELEKADVVYIGETSGDPDHHLIQLKLIEYLAAAGRLHAIGMEVFQRPFQGVLDDYVYARIGERELLARTEWDRRGGRSFASYRPILEFARQHRLPVRALDVEDEVRAPARRGGLAAVPESLRVTLPAVDTGTFPEHRAAWRALYDAQPDPASDEGFDNFYLVQALREDVMADGVVEWFRTAPDDGQIVVLAGSRHVAGRHGIPARAHRRNGKSYRIVVPLAAGEDGPHGTVFAHEYADFVWVTRTKPASPTAGD
jgi:uncharacterized iron-regulated protein